MIEHLEPARWQNRETIRGPVGRVLTDHAVGVYIA
jgi:hypothetical protein